MKPELDKALCEKYPKIFANRHADMKTTAMCWGFECGDGWYHIIDALCESFTHSYTTVKTLELDGRKMPEDIKYDNPEYNSYLWSHNGCANVIATQVKEKFGTLRFYYYTMRSDEDSIMAKKYPNTASAILNEQYLYTIGLVRMAEIMSSRVCEETGQIGELHSLGTGPGAWLKTLNKEYAKNYSFTDRNYIPCSDIKNEKVTETV